MLGKKVLNNVYWHSSVSCKQADQVQQDIIAAATLANLQVDIDFNVVKYDSNNSLLSLLWYPEFFDIPFPVLAISYRIDLKTRRVDKRSYQQSLNPPVLHRKELLLNPDDSRRTKFQELTVTAEQLGLFDDTVRIGFKQGWEKLIAEKGFQLINDQFIAIGNAEISAEIADQTISSTDIARHLTALSRSNFSAPMQCLARHGFLDGSLTVFDYGCGRGDDIRNLKVNAISVSGWDPYYAKDLPKQEADIVNLGFVINVIENPKERLEALQGAYYLARQLLVVSAMLINQNTWKGQVFNDGVLTSRQTFQKYFSQNELQAYLSDALAGVAIAVAPGIFYIFKDPLAEQRFLVHRQRSQRSILRLSARPEVAALAKLSRNEKKYQHYAHLLEPVWQQSLQLGRLPDKSELSQLTELTASFGSINKALHFMLAQNNATQLEKARQSRSDDLLVFLALQTFSQRKAYKHLDADLQKDIKAFFGDYKNAVVTAQARLYQISNTALITESCHKASVQGLGYLDAENALHIHSSLVEQLPSVLRIYIACATLLYGDIEQTDIIKIHSLSGKLSLLKYDAFLESPLPRLLERVKINLRTQSFDLYQYGENFEPTFLYLKSRFINEEFVHYAEQLLFDEQLQALQCFDFSGFGPKPEKFRQILEKNRWQIDGFSLIRSQTIPDLDTLCGRYLSYRQLIECGETFENLTLSNCPKQPDSYTALYDLAVHILDLVIDYYGMIRLTYGFCSHDLGKHIKRGVAPKLDQHAAHELNSKQHFICPRLGAAVDFSVDDENMREVADWVAANTMFDRLYFYGENRSIHVSFQTEPKGEYIDMVITENGRQIPKKHCYKNK